MGVRPEHAAGGPFYFALSESEEPDFGVEHHRYDEYVRSYKINQAEGDFATLTVEIKNPYRGLYAPGSKIYCWWAEDDGAGGVRPMFRGRLIGIPSGLLGEIIQLKYSAKPTDYADQVAALADTMRTLPEYDDVFVDEKDRSNPDVVLQGYSKLWHSDRVTHVVSASDILVGEDTAVAFNIIRYDTFNVFIEGNPRSSASANVSVSWAQQAAGTVDFGTYVFLGYSAGGMRDGWPQVGASFSGGWTVSEANVDGQKIELPSTSWSIDYQNEQKEHADGDTMSLSQSFSGPLGLGLEGDIILSEGGSLVLSDPITGTPSSASRNVTSASIAFDSSARCSLVLAYQANLKRRERLQVTLTADIQPVVQDDSTGGNNETLTLDGSDVGLAIDDVIPIGDLARNSYWATDRGIESAKNIICRLRARLLLSSRVGRAEWDCIHQDAWQLNCRRNALLRDRRIGDGEIFGKIIAYEISGNGDTGEFKGHGTLACAIGNGTAVVETAGTPDYVEDGYVNAGYQTYTGQFIYALDAGDVAITVPTFETGDALVFPLTKQQVLVSETIENTDEEQQDAIDRAKGIRSPTQANNAGDISETKSPGEQMLETIQKMAQSKQTKFRLEIKPVTGTVDDVTQTIDATILSIPKQLDLSAQP